MTRTISHEPGLSRGYPRRGQRQQSGMTIIEVMITLAVVGFLMLIGYSGVRYVAGSALRESATEVAQILRAAYNMATISGMHHRVIFDLENQSFRIETCEGDIRLRFAEKEEVPDEDEDEEDRSPEAARKKLRDSSIPAEVADAATPEEAAKMAAALSGSRVGTATCRPPELPTGDLDGRGAERQLDPDGQIKVRRMFVQHLEGEQSSGIVHVNFFPLGYGEKAMVEVGDESGDAYTVLIHAFTGRVELRNDRVDEDDFMYRRADGEKVEEREKQE